MAIGMRLDKETIVLLALVRAGLWERPADLGDMLPLTRQEWRCVWQMARCQTVAGLVYRGLANLPAPLLPPDELLFRWVAEADRIERAGNHHNRCVAELTEMFLSQGVRPVLLKGQGVACLYEYPLLREAGDIDLCFLTPQERAEAADILRAQGVSLQSAPDGSLSYMWRGVEVEHHAATTCLCAPKAKRYLHSLENECDFIHLPLGGNREQTVIVPSPMLTLVILNAHILHHAIGRGVGLRQLCDMARAYHSLMGRVDADSLIHAYEHLGLMRWSRLLHSFLVLYLGLNPSCLPMAGGDGAQSGALESPEALLKIVLGGGNFGKHRACTSAHAASLRDGDGETDAEEALPAGGAASPWMGKLNTAAAFVMRLPFSLKYAARETLFTMGSLARGQWRK